MKVLSKVFRMPQAITPSSRIEHMHFGRSLGVNHPGEGMRRPCHHCDRRDMLTVTFWEPLFDVLMQRGLIEVEYISSEFQRELLLMKDEQVTEILASRTYRKHSLIACTCGVRYSFLRISILSVSAIRAKFTKPYIITTKGYCGPL